MTQNQEASVTEQKENITEEALRWIRENKGLVVDPKVDSEKNYYGSPRISSELPDCSMPMTFDSYNFCSLGCTFCVTGNTGVATTGKTIPIKKLKVGDIVLSKNIDSGLLEEDPVVSVMQRNTNNLLRIHLENGKILEITPEHPVFVNGVGWKEAGQLLEGDDILFAAKPSFSYRQKNSNCMKNKLTKKKQAETMKKKFASGELDYLREKLKKSSTNNLIKWNKSKAGKLAVSTRMKNNNPMKKKEVAKAMGATLSARYSSGELIGHWKGKKAPHAAKRMSENNPMKDPEIRRPTLQKIVKSWAKNGKISAGEHKVREAIESLGVSFVHQAVVPGPKRDFIIDFMLPEHNLCVEYDGHSRHYTESGIEHDKLRDDWMMKEYGVRTIRIHRDKAFIPNNELQAFISREISL